MFDQNTDESINTANAAGLMTETQTAPPDAVTELINKQEKQLRYAKISCIAVFAMAVILLIVCVIIVPKAIHTLSELNALIEEASEVMDNANVTLAGIDSMSAEITTAADGINDLVDENSDVLKDSMSKLNAIDFEGLNEAIGDLQAVVEPMANFMNRFR